MLLLQKKKWSYQMEINTIKKLEKKALKSSGFDFMRLGIALIFIVIVMFYTMRQQAIFQIVCF